MVSICSKVRLLREKRGLLVMILEDVGDDSDRFVDCNLGRRERWAIAAGVKGKEQ